MQFFDNLKPLGLLVLRLALGASFIFHGYPKLTDPEHALRAFAGYGFPGYFAYIFGILEVFGGGLLIAGLFTRGAALLLTIETGLVLYKMIVPSEGMKGFPRIEMPLLLGAMALALVTTGAGLISVDAFTFESGRKSPKKVKAKN
ncbi:MAG TPA: DoxX family protein [Candidatus Saccharimonadales bacterium]|jgi:putative oxidoreductase|nr:DoxX family protein [Candidatus Saccharimonadales bacterium]